MPYYHVKCISIQTSDNDDRQQTQTFINLRRRATYALQ